MTPDLAVPELGASTASAGRDASPIATSQPTEPLPASPVKLCVLRGRVLFSNGAAASGVAAHLDGRAANSERLKLHGEPREWSDTATTTDAEGRFELRFDPPRAYQFHLALNPAAHPGVRWRWSELMAGEVVDLGDIVLSDAGTIEGELVDAAGRPQLVDWTVDAVDPRQQSSERDMREPQRLHTKLDPATGRFTFANAPVGFLRLQARHASQAESQAQTIEVRAGETTTVKLVYAGPRLDDRITARLVTGRFISLLVGEENKPRATLRGGGVERSGVPIPRSVDRVEFVDLASGVYALSVRHPLFEDWDQSGLAAGSSVRAQLVPRAKLILEVVDAADGTPIREHHVSASYAPEDVPVPSNVRLGSAVEVELHPLGARDATLPLALVPLKCDLRVEAPGRMRGEILGIQPVAGGQLSLRVALGKGATARVALSTRGVAVPGAKLGICPADRFVETPTQGQYIPPGSADAARTSVSDAAGVASFESLAPGAWVAFAEVHPLLRVHQRFVVGGEASRVEVTLELPPNGRLEGRVLGLAPDELSRSTIQALPPNTSEIDQFRLRHFGWFARTKREAATSIEPDGSFVIPWLPQGEFDIHLSSSSGQARSIGVARIVDGTTTRQDFDAATAKLGTIALRVTLSGAAAARAGVRFVPSSSSVQYDTNLVLDDDGRVQTELAPGEYKLLFQAADGAWQTMTDMPWTVPPGARVEHAHDIPVGRGTLQFVDATTLAPLAKASFQFVDRHGIYTPLRTTDEQGQLELTLPAGTWEVIHGPSPGRTSTLPVARVEWTVSGPLPTQLKIAP